MDSINSSQILGDLVTALYALTSVDDRFNAYAAVVEGLGFDAVCYSFAPSTSLQPSLEHPPIFKVSAQFSASFLKQYEEEDFYNIDFTIREIEENKLNTKDWKEYETSGTLSDKEVGLIKIAREQHGINNGLSIPTMKHALGIAGASIISYQDDATYQRLKQQHLPLLKTCTQVFNDIIMLQSSFHLAESFVIPQLPKITPKEKIVICELLEGIKLKNIGMLKGMSQSAVENHLTNLRKKFDVRTTHDLKYLLESLNLVEYL